LAERFAAGKTAASSPAGRTEPFCGSGAILRRRLVGDWAPVTRRKPAGERCFLRNMRAPGLRRLVPPAFEKAVFFHDDKILPQSRIKHPGRATSYSQKLVWTNIDVCHIIAYNSLALR
jgi:hypothetical protein